MVEALTIIVLAPDALFKVLSADGDRGTGFRLDRDFRFGLGGGRWGGRSHSRVHLGLLAGFTGGGGRGDCRGCGRPLAGLPGPVGPLGEALYLEGLGDLEELIQLLLGHVDFSVVHEVEDVLHVLGGDSPANGSLKVECVTYICCISFSGNFFLFILNCDIVLDCHDY